MVYQEWIFQINDIVLLILVESWKVEGGSSKVEAGSGKYDSIRNLQLLIIDE